MRLLECLQPYMNSVPVRKEVEYELNIAPVPDDIELRLAALGFEHPRTTFVFDRVFKSKDKEDKKVKFRVRRMHWVDETSELQLTVKHRLPHPEFKSAQEEHFDLEKKSLRALLIELRHTPQIRVGHKYRIRRTWSLPKTPLHVHVDTYADGFCAGEMDCSDEQFFHDWLHESGSDLLLTTTRTSALRRVWEQSPVHSRSSVTL